MAEEQKPAAGGAKNRAKPTRKPKPNRGTPRNGPVREFRSRAADELAKNAKNAAEAAGGTGGYSTTVRRQPFVMKHYQTCQVVSRMLVPTTASLYLVDAVLRFVGNDKQADQVIETIDKLLNNVQNALDTELKRIDKMIEQRGLDPDNPEYEAGEPVTATVKVNTPQARVLYGLLRRFDEFVGKTYILYLEGVLTGGQRKEGVFTYQQRLIRLGRQIMDIRLRAMAAARRKGMEDEVTAKAKEVLGDALDAEIDVNAEKTIATESLQAAVEAVHQTEGEGDALEAAPSADGPAEEAPAAADKPSRKKARAGEEPATAAE